MAHFKGKTPQQTADVLNGDMGVTRAQAAAMLAGVTQGWTSPAADPNRYNERGRPVKPRRHERVTMTEQRHLIWSNYDLDYEDWRDDLEEDHPELTEDERMALMYEINNRYLDDERVNLNIQLDQPILVIADLGLWNGRRTGYQEISSGNIRDCLYSGRDIEYATWYVDKLGDLRCDAIHHDGTNHLLYRTYKPGARDSQIDLLKEKLYYGKAVRSDITRITRRLGDEIGKVYGWDFPKPRQAVSVER